MSLATSPSPRPIPLASGVPLSFVKPTPTPNEDAVLTPLHTAQAVLAAQQAATAARVAEAAAKALVTSTTEAQAAREVQPPQPETIVSAQPSDSGAGYKAWIYNEESGNNPGSINKSSGACGLGQAEPCSKLPCSLSDYACQDAWFTNVYMIPRYGTWQNAYAFHIAHGWW